MRIQTKPQTNKQTDKQIDFHSRKKRYLKWFPRGRVPCRRCAGGSFLEPTVDKGDENSSHIALNDCQSNAEEKEEGDSRAVAQELRG